MLQRPSDDGIAEAKADVGTLRTIEAVTVLVVVENMAFRSSREMLLWAVRVCLLFLGR